MMTRLGATSPNRRRLGLLAAGAALVASSPAAQAQTIINVGDNFVQPDLPLTFDRGQNTGVLDRERPEYEAHGIPLGGFVLHPRIEGDVGYTDNVYETTAKTGAAYAELKPSVQITSNWPRNELGLDGGVDVIRFASQTRRNQFNWHVNGDGRYEFGQGFSVSAQAGTSHNTEPATSAAYPTAAAQASQYQATTVQIAPAYVFGRVKLQAAYDFTAYSFDPYVTFAGTTVDQSNRDSTTNGGSGRAEYALSPATSVFVQGGYDHTSYSHLLLPGVPNRDSIDYRVLGGLSFDVAKLVRGAFAVGYMQRDYTDTALYGSIGGLSAEGRIDWFVDTLTTFTLSGRRVIEDAPFVNGTSYVSGFVNSSIALRADHEILRNLLIDAQVAYEHDAFKGVNETVDIVRLSGGARYLLSRSVGLGLTLSHDARATSGALNLATYTETRAMFSLVLQK